MKSISKQEYLKLRKDALEKFKRSLMEDIEDIEKHMINAYCGGSDTAIKYAECWSAVRELDAHIFAIDCVLGDADPTANPHLSIYDYEKIYADKLDDEIEIEDITYKDKFEK